jgi:hypothetical protein
MLVSMRRALARISLAVAGPDERFGARVPMRDVVAYLVDQDFDTTEGAPTDGLASDDAKPSFDLIKPG